jgi:small subunit ribosomal protein S9
MEITNKLGRRKTAIARMRISSGKGTFSVNGRDYKEYFPFEVLQIKALQPISLLNLNLTDYDIYVNVNGGGVNGQAEAIRLALARYFADLNQEYRSALKKEGYLTRDPRMVERKKYGQKKARKNFQFSKR